MSGGAPFRPAPGLLALAFYLAHGAVLVREEHPANLLWLCHLGVVLVGLGWLARWRAILAVGALWLTLGLPLWLLDLAGGGRFYPTSLFAHGGGLLIGLAGLRRSGVPRGSWWRALAAGLFLQFCCRWATPPGPNVNLSHAVWHGWEGLFPSYFVYWALLAAAGGLVFFAGEAVMRRCCAAGKE